MHPREAIEIYNYKLYVAPQQKQNVITKKGDKSF